VTEKLRERTIVFKAAVHNILITRLSSWFGIHGSVLCWFNFYLSSLFFPVKWPTTSLPCILPLVVFSKGLFSALYSSSCTPPLSLLRSLPFPLTTTFMQITLNSSFHLVNFDSSISHLQDTLHQISSWMTANLLTLNYSRSEFLLIELEDQLANLHNSSLDTSHSARNLGFISDEHLTFSDQITALSRACYYHIRQHTFSDHALLPPPSTASRNYSLRQRQHSFLLP